MSNLTMLDIAARTNNDLVVGLIEDVTTYSPEFRSFPVRPIAGVTYMVGRRTALPASVFRDVNEGVATGKSTFVQELKQCYFLDAQMQVDEAIVGADDRSLGDILAQEGAGALESAINTIGSQTYYGTSANAKGFAGLASQLTVDTVYAGGTTNTTSAYLVDLSIKGVHFVLGKSGAIMMPDWAKQQVSDGTNPYMAWVSNLSAWLGLQVGSASSVFRVRGIDATNKLSDLLGAKCLNNVPIARRNGNLRWLMNSTAAYSLQVSRSSVGYQSAGSDGTGAFAPAPTELAGIPIILTDSLVSTEITTNG